MGHAGSVLLRTRMQCFGVGYRVVWCVKLRVPVSGAAPAEPPRGVSAARRPFLEAEPPAARGSAPGPAPGTCPWTLPFRVPERGGGHRALRREFPPPLSGLSPLPSTLGWGCLRRCAWRPCGGDGLEPID